MEGFSAARRLCLKKLIGIARGRESKDLDLSELKEEAIGVAGTEKADVDSCLPRMSVYLIAEK